MKRLSKNFISIIGSDIARRILGFLAIAYLARKVGVEGFGILNIGLTVLSYALMLSSAGLTSFGARAAARGESSGLVNAIVTIRLIGSFIAFIIVGLIAVLFISNDRMEILIIIFCFSLFPNAFLLDWYFQGKERMGVIGLSRLVSAVIYLVVIISFVRTITDLVWVALAAVIGDIIASSVVWVFYRKLESDTRFSLSLFGWRSLIVQSLPLGAGSILGSISANMPPIIIGIMLGSIDVGIYSAASKLVLFLLMLDRVLATLLLPAASRLSTQSIELLVSRLRFALKWIFITTLPICIGGTIIADKIMLLVFGNQYILSVNVFRILIWYFFVTMLHTIYASGIIAVGREKDYAAVMFISTFVYLISIILGTKLLGLIGSAAAMVCSEVVTLLLMRDRFERIIKLNLPSVMVKIIIAAIVMGGIVFLLPPMNVFLTILIGAMVYSFLLYITKAVTIDEVSKLLEHV